MEKLTIQTLLVEDNPGDVVLLRVALDHDLLANFQLQAVEYLADALDLLRKRSFDVILLDLGLPDSQGLQTFQRVHQAAPDIPIVILSGLADENFALQAVQAGVQDYLVKNAREFSSASRAIRYAVERQHAHQNLQKSEARYHRMVDSMMEGLQIISCDWRYIYINEAAAAQGHRSSQELTGQTMMEAYPGIEKTPLFDTLRECMLTRSSKRLENQFIYPDGSQGWFELSIQPADDGLLILSTEITERKTAEEDLQASERNLKLFIENAPAAIAMFDREMRYLAASRRFINDYRLPDENLIGRSHYEVFPELTDRMKAVHKRCLAGASEKNDEAALLRSDGSLDWIKWEMLPWHTNSGEIGGVLLFSEVITERKKSEESLRESEARFRQMAENIQEIFWLYDRQAQKLIYVSPAYEKIWGSSMGRQADSLEQLADAAQTTDRHILLKILQDQANGLQTDEEYRLIRPDGSVRWIYDRSVPIFDANGVLVRTAGISTDITERKLAEVALRASEEKYRLLSEQLEQRVLERSAEVSDLYENAPCGYHSLDENGNFVNINRTALTWRGYTREEIIGDSFYSHLVDEYSEAFHREFQNLKQDGQIKDLELEIRRKDGSTFPILLSATAIYDETGKFFRSRSMIVDNTDRKKAEIALRQSRDELGAAYAALEKASHTKDEFLANMSHELRTPLNGILGMAEILMTGVRGPLNAQQQKMIQLIDSSGKHLLSLINDILDLSKIEAGKLDIHPEMISIRDVCVSSLSFVREPANKKNVQLEFVPDPVVSTVMADSRRLKQILINLLSNAVKFTPSGGHITLEVKTNASTNRIDLSVIDNGIGIPAQEINHLFAPFTQVDNSLTRQHEGTGLGLALVKHLTELHGGSVAVSSEVGVGSRFTVSLPWMADPLVQEILTSPVQDHSGAGVEYVQPALTGTILFVDDIETNILTIGGYLETIGCQMFYARDGYEALTKTEQCSPDLILMDIQLPGMDGLEVTRRLRADPRFASTPIIALTSLALPGDRERCLAAGATEYQSKPVVLQQLAFMIASLLNKK